MTGGDGGPDGEDPALLSPAGEEVGERGRVSSGQHDTEAQSEHLSGGENEPQGGDVGQEDEEMTSGSNDLSSPSNHSPGSATGSTSASTKRYFTDCFSLTLLV